MSKLYDLHVTKGIMELDAERFEAARGEFEKALRERPNEPEANYLMGLVLLELHDLDGAELRLKKVLELDPSYAGIHYQWGSLYFKKEAYPDALKAFVKAEKLEPKRAMIYYYKGLIYDRLGEYERAPAQFLKAVSLDPALSAVAYYYSGVSYYKTGIYEEAEEAFEKVIQFQPGSDLAASSRKYLDELKKVSKRPPKWDLALSLGFQHDSNVVLEPSDSSVVGVVTDEKDNRYVAYFKGGYRFVDRPAWHVGGGYAFFQSLQQALEDFDVTSHDWTVYSLYNRDPYQTRFQYNYHQAAVGGNRYLSLHGLNPVLNLSWKEDRITQFQYRLQLKDFVNSDQFPGNSDRDGMNHLIGLTQFFSLPRGGDLRIGYAYDRDATDGDDWDYQGHRISSGLSLPLPLKSKLELSAEWHPKAYDNPNSASVDGKKRDDQYQAYGLVLSRDFARHFTLTGQVFYSKNDSNLPIFEYNRTVYAFAVGWRR